MHQYVKGDPVPEKTEEVNLWAYYLSDNIQWAADRMPVDNFLSLLFSQSTAAIEVVSANPASPGTLVLEIRGRCFDAPATFKKSLERKELNPKQRRRLLELLKNAYQAEKNLGMPTPRKAAKAMNIDYK